MSDTASGEWRDQTHWPRRVGSCPSEARKGLERGSARGELQKISAGKFHGTALKNNPTLLMLHRSATRAHEPRYAAQVSPL